MSLCPIIMISIVEHFGDHKLLTPGFLNAPDLPRKPNMVVSIFKGNDTLAAPPVA